MNTNRRGHLVVPIAILVGGSAIAGATVAGSSWGSALTVEIFVVLATLGLWALGRSDSDVGAVVGRHEDERQTAVRNRAYALAMKVMYLAAFVCVVIAVAMKKEYWQADVIGSCGGLTFLLGLRLYGGEPVAASDIEGVDARRSSGAPM